MALTAPPTRIAVAGTGIALTSALLAACPGARSVGPGDPFAGVSGLVIVGEPFPGPGGGVDGLGRRLEPAAVRDLLRLGAAAGISHVVLVSSAMAYGAWPNNPVPLTEEANIRPEPRNVLAVSCSEAERLLAQWCSDDPSRTSAILRPALVSHEGQAGWLSRSPWGGRGPAVVDPAPPMQYLHLDDLVAALLVALRTGFDGVLNVAPDGWLSDEQVRALAGPVPRIKLPLRLARGAQRARWRSSSEPALVPFDGVMPYASHSWVVANDALRRLGWAAGSTNEEAFIAGSPAGPLTGMSPKRRQVLALGAAAAAIAAAATGIALLLRRPTEPT